MFDLFNKSKYQSRCSNFENPTGGKGTAASMNKGAKGHPCETLLPGETKTLIEFNGCGIVTRIWLGTDQYSPKGLRSMRLDMYWDGAKTPAVSAPAGDFFNMAHSRMAAFDSELFSNPEGRSMNCFVPMPFRKRARITLTYEGTGKPALLFYDISFLAAKRLPKDALYFHAHWRRENPTTLGKDFEILPKVTGAGRFLGCNIGAITDARYEDAWWGEGEMKAWLDGDKKLPSIAGTGTEDYILSAWGQKTFSCRYHGATVADPEHRQWGFYRHHLPDPILFQKDCKITIQQMGGAMRAKVARLMKQNGAPLIPVSLATSRDPGHSFTLLLEQKPPCDITDPKLPDTWCNFYRSDDVSACAYFYLDKPENHLPPLQPVAERIAGLSDEKP